MSEENLQKYVIIREDSSNDINERIDEYVKLGYRLHTLTTPTYSVDSVGYVSYVALMSLKDTGKYDDITELEDVQPIDVNDYLHKGYVILETFSKSVRMVKKG